MEWVSIKDGLPDLDRWVILTDGKKYGLGLRWISKGMPKWNVPDTEHFTDYVDPQEISEITHWAYAPELPKE